MVESSGPVYETWTREQKVDRSREQAKPKTIERRWGKRSSEGHQKEKAPKMRT